MSTKELILTEIDKLSDRRLEELYLFVQKLARREAKSNDPRSIFDKLQDVHIDAPADFSANFEQYGSGEKRGEDLR
jgi:hypothetical protein